MTLTTLMPCTGAQFFISEVSRLFSILLWQKWHNRNKHSARAFKSLKIVRGDSNHIHPGHELRILAAKLILMFVKLFWLLSIYMYGYTNFVIIETFILYLVCPLIHCWTHTIKYSECHCYSEYEITIRIVCSYY